MDGNKTKEQHLQQTQETPRVQRQMFHMDGNKTKEQHLHQKKAKSWQLSAHCCMLYKKFRMTFLINK